MIPDINDTIAALATPSGPGACAIIRLSGPAAHTLASNAFANRDSLPGSMSGNLRIPEIASTVVADLHLWTAPHSYTGQDMAEIHCLSSPPLLELAVAGLLRAGARSAQPGEFTLRAFLSGKLDLPRAEAVLGVIDADDASQLKQALAQLAGNLSQPLQKLRDDLLNLLADVEASLDFGDEDIRFVNEEDLLGRLASGMAHLVLLQRQLHQRAVSEQPFRVVLAGEPNVGKSSLFNELIAEEGALVSPIPGTTRDYLSRRLTWDGVVIELIDTAGWQCPTEGLDEQAQSLGHDQALRADLVLHCITSAAHSSPAESRSAIKAMCEDALCGITDVDLGPSNTIQVYTKCDLGECSSDHLSTSVVTGEGLSELRQRILERAQVRKHSALAPSVSRCSQHVTACLEHLRHAHSLVLEGDPPELLALELRSALDQLGEMVGAIFTDDLLDRVFSRFCIGK